MFEYSLTPCHWCDSGSVKEVKRVGEMDVGAGL